jgi:hypothetical protein
VLEEHCNRFGAACTCRSHQRGLSAQNGGVEIGAAFEQRAHNGCVTASGRLQQRSHAESIRRIYVGPGIEQNSDHLGIGLIGGPEKRRRSIRFDLVDRVPSRE